MTVHYALDFGTTNSVLTSDRDGGVAVVTLCDVAADRARTPVVPSAVCFGEGRSAPRIGQLAVSQNALGRLPNFAQGFKRKLGRESHRPVARINGTDISARLAAESFFDGLRSAVRQEALPALREQFANRGEEDAEVLADIMVAIASIERATADVARLPRSIAADEPATAGRPRSTS